MNRLATLSLRSRLLMAFVAIALLLSVAVAAVSYSLTERYLWSQRETGAIGQTGAAATSYDRRLAGSDLSPDELLSAINRALDSEPAVRLGNRWLSVSPLITEEAIPLALRQKVAAGGRGEQQVRLGGVPSLVVGVPLASGAGQYYEVFKLTEFHRSLNTMRVILAVVASLAAAAGAGVALLTSRRLVRPLRAVSEASARLGAGQLDTRLPVTEDPDLRPLVSSYNAMADTLQARIERDARFAGDVSHELRSPLTALEASLTVLESRRDELPERVQEALDLLAGEVRRFERIVIDLLEISRVEATSTASEAGEPVCLADVVRLAGSDAPVHIDPAVATALVPGDKRRLERVVRNLVDNANQHGGGVTGVHVIKVGELAQLHVDDSGPGVALAHREQIFERFARGAGSGRRGGSGVGLGLPIVAEHVRICGGRTWVESGPMGGARFVVELPVVADQDSGVELDEDTPAN